MAKNTMLIDLEHFVLHVEGKSFKEKLRLKFDSPSRKFYLAVIGLVLNEMKKLGKVTSIKMENYYDVLVLMNETLGNNLGGSGKKAILGRLYRKWRVLGKLEKAPLFEIMDQERIYVKDHREKCYIFEEEEKDAWSGLFEIKGSEEGIRLRFSIDRLDIGLDSVSVVYRGENNAWERFIQNLNPNENLTASTSQNNQGNYSPS